MQPANVPLEAVDRRAAGLDRPPVIVLRGGDDRARTPTGVREQEARAVAALLHDAVIGRSAGRSATGRPARCARPAGATSRSCFPRAPASRPTRRRSRRRDPVPPRGQPRLLPAPGGPRPDRPPAARSTTRATGSAWSARCARARSAAPTTISSIHRATGGAWDYRVDERERVRARDARRSSSCASLHRARGRLSLPELVQRVVEREPPGRVRADAARRRRRPPRTCSRSSTRRAPSPPPAAAACGPSPAGSPSTPRREANEVDAGIAEETDDVVRIMTMHGVEGPRVPDRRPRQPRLGAGRHRREPVPDEAERLLHFRVGSGGTGPQRSLRHARLRRTLGRREGSARAPSRSGCSTSPRPARVTT